MRYSIQKWVLFCVMVLGAGSAEGMMTSLKEWGGTIQKYSGYLLNSVKNFSSGFPLWSYEKPVLPTATPSTGISPKSSSVEPSLVNEVFAHMTKNQGVGTAFDPGHFSEAISAVLNKQRAQYRQNLEKNKAELLQKLEKSSMKYTMSFVHMADRFKWKGIVLAPTGLWNGGKYTSDAKDRWEIEYKGKKYVSTFNKDKKIWEADEQNQMDLLTYYEYVSTQNWGELRNLYGYLIDVLKPISMFESNKVRASHIKEIFLDALMREEQYKDHIVFYQGGRGMFAILEAFNTALHRYRDLSFMRRGRSQFEDLSPYASSHEFLEKHKYMQNTEDNDLNGALIATNLGLFGNFDQVGESTVEFFMHGSNINLSVYRLKRAVKGVLINAKIPIDYDTVEKFIQRIVDSHNLKGRLTQIFIPQNYVDKFAYISLPFGNLGKKTEGGYEDFTPRKVVSQMRSAGHAIRSSLGDPQGRILWSLFADPEAAEKMGVKTFHYYAEKGDREKVKSMAEKVDAFVKKLIVDALKKGTLKAKDVKLLALKKAVEEKMKGGAGSSAEKSDVVSGVVKE